MFESQCLSHNAFLRFSHQKDSPDLFKNFPESACTSWTDLLAYECQRHVNPGACAVLGYVQKILFKDQSLTQIFTL